MKKYMMVFYVLLITANNTSAMIVDVLINVLQTVQCSECESITRCNRTPCCGYFVCVDCTKCHIEEYVNKNYNNFCSDKKTENLTCPKSLCEQELPSRIIEKATKHELDLYDRYLDIFKQIYLESTEQQPMKCDVCYEEMPLNKRSIMPCCKYILCANCIKDYVISCLETSNSKDVRCPSRNCDRKINQVILQRISANNDELFKLYEKVALIELLNKAKVKQCPTPNCTFQFFNEKCFSFYSLTRQEARALINCPDCDNTYCSSCLCLHDLKIPCDQVIIIKDKQIQMQASQEWIQNNTKQCAQCGNAVEKNRGCNHMTCKCGYEFCWVCQKGWGATTCSYFQHYDEEQNTSCTIQ